MTNSILQVLMTRDSFSEEDALDLIMEARAELNDYLEEGNITCAENICSDYFGLEPDYLDDLLSY